MPRSGSSALHGVNLNFFKKETTYLKTLRTKLNHLEIKRNIQTLSTMEGITLNILYVSLNLVPLFSYLMKK